MLYAMKYYPPLLALLLWFLVVGCDYIHGVSRVSTDFTPYPGSNCVVDAVKSIDGMSNVFYQKESGGRRLTLHGMEKPDEIHRFWYEYKGLRNNFYFLVDYKGHVQLHHSFGCLDCTPPQEQVDKIYPAILAVEEALESRCGITGLRSNIKEYCSGVHCGGV